MKLPLAVESAVTAPFSTIYKIHKSVKKVQLLLVSNIHLDFNNTKNHLKIIEILTLII